MKIVNIRNGRVLVENDNGKGCEAVFDYGWEYNEAIDCICKDGVNVAVDDVAGEKEISYREYKNGNYQAKKDSYNPDTKTIVVYIFD